MAKEKKQNWFIRAWGAVCKYFRELFSDLKKVTWPTAKQLVKNTITVVVCVLVVGVFIWLFDFVAGLGINELLKLPQLFT